MRAAADADWRATAASAAHADNVPTASHELAILRRAISPLRQQLAELAASQSRREPEDVATCAESESPSVHNFVRMHRELYGWHAYTAPVAPDRSVWRHPQCIACEHDRASGGMRERFRAA